MIHEANPAFLVIDNHWQTETGWPMLAICRGVEDSKIKLGSPAFPVFGYDLRLFHERRLGSRRQREGHHRDRPHRCSARLPVDRVTGRLFCLHLLQHLQRPGDLLCLPTGVSTTRTATVPSSDAWTT